MPNSPTVFPFFLLMHVNSCVLIDVKPQIAAFCDSFLIFERRKIDFERTHQVIPQVLTHLEGLNILCKRCIFFFFFYYLDKSEILLSVSLPLILSLNFSCCYQDLHQYGD